VTQASGNLVLGIYDASGPNGGPGALKAQTTSFTPVVGWNTANVITPVSLPAGTYWLAYLPSSNSLAFMKGLTSGVGIQYYSHPFGALPATFSTSPSADPYHWSFYATLNPASTISSISLSKSSFAAGAPSGTVGTISVNMSSGSFTGSLSLSGANASDFKIVGSNLETNGVLPPGPCNINIVATQSGAANSPFTQAEIITAVSQSISSVSLSNGSFVGGSASGTIVGAINVTMSPSSPAFSGSLSLSTTKGGCTATNGANDSSFAISGNKLITNGTVAPGTYAVCILATEASASNSPVGQAEKLTANSTNITIGETNQLAGGVIGDANLLFAQSAALSQTATIESLSIYAAAGTGNLILGIYADNGSGAPGVLQAQTASFSAAAGWNTANVTAPVSLQPGTYWLAWLTDSNALSVPGVTTGTDAYYPFSFGSLPSTFSGTATVETAHRSLYATLNTGAVSQSISSVSLSNGSFLGGSPSGTIVGAINVTMSPSSPAFSGSLSLSTTQGGCTATNGANNSSFAISGGKLVTNGTVPPGTYAVCILATQTGATNSPFRGALTITASSQSTASLSANPTTIASGQSSTLTWSSTGATSCTGTNFSTGSGTPTSGSTTVSPTQTTTYSVTCTNGTNSGQATATVTVSAGGQSIQSLGLSGTGFTSGSPAGTYIGTLTTNMNPVTPVFSGSYQLSTSGSNSGGVCNSTNGAGNGSFQIVGDAVETNGTPAAGTYAICIAATEGAVSAGKAFTLTAGRFIQATSFCASNGGGDGTSGNPWHSMCINAAIAAAASGDTIFLAAGNWELNIAEPPVNTSKAVNVVGAGSGNTFDAMGHPNNAGPTILAATPGGNITAVRSAGPNSLERDLGTACGQQPSTPGGWWRFTGSNQNVAHIFFDGSTGSTGSADCGVLTYYNAAGPGVLDDIRVLQFNDPDYTYSPEGRVSMTSSQNITVKNSTINNPINIRNTAYCMADAFQMSANRFITITNVYLYQMGLNPIYSDNSTIIGVTTWNQNDANCANTEAPSPTTGWDGNGIGPGATSNFDQGSGSYHFTMSNNLFAAVGYYFGLGAGVNDPTTNGGVTDLNFTGNWLIGSHMSIDSCASHNYDPGHWTGNFNPDYQGCAPDDPNGGGQQVNATWQPWVSCSNASVSDPPNRDNPNSTNGISYGFNATNNSIIGTTSGGVSGAAQLVATGTGIVPCYPTFGGQPVSHTGTTVNFRAHQNYLSSPANRYVSGTETINPSVTGNFCGGGGGTFTQTDSTQCATTGFTQVPTASFSLGNLSKTTVPFTATNFTAQYGAVKWIASTSSTTPTSGDSRWSYVPPFSLTPVTHGNTVYLWVMDSANHISAPASALIP
jgi:hypothetical protein